MPLLLVLALLGPVHGQPGHVCRQPRRVVTWRVAEWAELPGVPPRSLHAALDRAARLWSACGVECREALPGEPADVTADVRWIDGTFLGASYTAAMVRDWPCRGPVAIDFDEGEPWDVAKLERVAVHEFGHALGLRHDGGDSAMIPCWRTSSRVPTVRDRREVARRYP